VGEPLRRVLLPRIKLIAGDRTSAELLRGRLEVDAELLRRRRGFHRLRGTFRHGVSVARCRTRTRRSGQRYPFRTGSAREDPASVEGLVRSVSPRTFGVQVTSNPAQTAAFAPDGAYGTPGETELPIGQYTDFSFRAPRRAARPCQRPRRARHHRTYSHPSRDAARLPRGPGRPRPGPDRFRQILRVPAPARHPPLAEAGPAADEEAARPRARPHPRTRDPAARIAHGAGKARAAHLD